MTLSKRPKSLATVKAQFLAISILPWSSSWVIMPVVVARYRMFRTRLRRVHKWSKGSEGKKTFKRYPAAMCGFWVRSSTSASSCDVRIISDFSDLQYVVV